MPRTPRTVTPATKQALVEFDGLKMTLLVREPADPEAVVVEDIEAKCAIPYDDGTMGTSNLVNIAGAFNPADLTKFGELVDQLRDYLLDQSGVTEDA